MHNIVLGNIQLILSIIKKKCFWPSTFFYLVSIIKDYSVGNVCKTKASCVPLSFFPEVLHLLPHNRRGGAGGQKILKLSTLKDEFLHHLREFLNQSTGFV